MSRYGRIALVGSLAVAAKAYGDKIYDVNPAPTALRSGNGFAQQTGENAYEIGDSVTLTSSAPRALDNINIAFVFFTYTAIATYAPDLILDLYRANAAGFPLDGNTTDSMLYTPLASSEINNVTFSSTHGQSADAVLAKRYLTFNFSGVTLPDNFAFAYRDINPAGTTFPAWGFSVFISGAKPDSSLPGSSSNGALSSAGTPSGGASTWFTRNGIPTSTGGNIEAEIFTHPVPEPASLGVLGLGSLLALRRRTRPLARP